ncbi:MAG: hypothetical protein Q7S23_01255 [bacterium]|nr:hypothetical protein [bacterium]
MKKIALWSTAVALVVVHVVPVLPAAAAGTLIKAVGNSAVYFLDTQGVRHAFPNAPTYRSWYGDDFSAVQTVAALTLAGYPLGRNLTMKPGTALLKVPSAPTVYAVEQGGVLRPISSAEVAAAIFGSRWQQRVVDLPEVFFENYAVGEPLDRTYQLPSSIVYQVRGQGTYYWKQGNLLQPFADWAAVFANGYRKEDVVTGARTLPTRARQIFGADTRIADPLAPREWSTQDCGGTTITIAPILVARGELAASYRESLAAVHARLPEAYAWATQQLGAAEIADPVVLTDDGLLSRATPQGGRVLTEETALRFYDQHPDAYDFLILFTNFAVQEEKPNHEGHETLVTNGITGLSLPLQNAADLFGSRGKLKGIIVMGDLGRFTLTEESDALRLDNFLLHELGHQWGARVKFRTADDQDSVALLRDDGIHWSYYAGFISPLGGSGWRPLGDGKFLSKLAEDVNLIRRPYSDLDLYLMGLLPRQAVRPFTYLEPTVPGAQGNIISGVEKTVTIEQVIAANSPRRCELR